MKISKLGVRRAFAATAVAAVAAVGLSSMGAGGAAAAKLPNGYKKITGVDGNVLQLWRTGETATAQQSEAHNGAGRSARSSGTYTARVARGGGNLEVGYVVGCQVNLGSLDAGISGTISASPTIGGTLSLPLAPGQITTVAIDNKDFKKKVVSLQFSDVEVEVQGCGGYAQARSYMKVIAADGYNTNEGTVNGKSGAIQATLYGRPFSLG